jgi:predicted transposase YdaD
LAEARENYRRDGKSRREYAGRRVEEKGRQKGRQEVVRRLPLRKESVETVAEVTGISLEEVKALAVELPIKHC